MVRLRASLEGSSHEVIGHEGMKHQVVVPAGAGIPGLDQSGTRWDGTKILASISISMGNRHNLVTAWWNPSEGLGRESRCYPAKERDAASRNPFDGDPVAGLGGRWGSGWISFLERWHPLGGANGCGRWWLHLHCTLQHQSWRV